MNDNKERVTSENIDEGEKYVNEGVMSTGVSGGPFKGVW